MLEPDPTVPLRKQEKGYSNRKKGGASRPADILMGCWVIYSSFLFILLQTPESMACLIITQPAFRGWKHMPRANRWLSSA